MVDARPSLFQKYILPGLVFQGVLIGGGYATGREIVEYFMKYGPLGGISGMLISLVVWSLILAVTFEFSRRFKTYDYRSLLMSLLGPIWFVFEIFYIVLLVIVLAVVGSAAGVLLRDYLSIPYLVGVTIMLAAIGFLTFKGSDMIEKFSAVWSPLIYVVYVLFLVVSLVKFGSLIRENLTSAQILPGWAIGGFKYGLYNMCVIPAILFCVRHIETRKEAVSAGVIAAFVGLMPAFLFFVAIVGHYPEVVSEEIPAVFVLERAQAPLLLIIFVIVMFGTLIQTGTGFIHGVNERLQASLQAKGKEFPSWQRPVIALFLLLISLGLSSFGIIRLVAQGYGFISWGIFAIYFVPLMTLGVYKVLAKKEPVRPPHLL